MRRKANLSAVLLLAAAILCAAALAAPAVADDTVSVVKLVDNMQRYDGKEVTIRGEAIGDIMVRGAHAWITVNDDPFSLNRSIEEGGELIGMSNAGIGVWLQAEGTRDINVLGGYKNKGAMVRVTGTFNRACTEHGGDTDIHATRLVVLKEGHPFEHPFAWGKFLALVVLVLAAAALWAWKRHQERVGLREARKVS